MSHVTYGQKGYDGCSMSVRARAAYDDGEMPRSKWSKAAMVAAIRDYCADNARVYNPSIERRTTDDLFRSFFLCTSYHHTGKFARDTAFYSLDGGAVCGACPPEFRPEETNTITAYYVRRAPAARRDDGLLGITWYEPDDETGDLRVFPEYYMAVNRVNDWITDGDGAAVVSWGVCRVPCARRELDRSHASDFREKARWTVLVNGNVLSGSLWDTRAYEKKKLPGVLSLDGGETYRAPESYSVAELEYLFRNIRGPLPDLVYFKANRDYRRRAALLCRFAPRTVYNLGDFEPEGVTFNGGDNWYTPDDLPLTSGYLDRDWWRIENASDGDLMEDLYRRHGAPVTPQERRDFLKRYLSRAGWVYVWPDPPSDPDAAW